MKKLLCSFLLSVSLVACADSEDSLSGRPINCDGIDYPVLCCPSIVTCKEDGNPLSCSANDKFSPYFKGGVSNLGAEVKTKTKYRLRSVTAPLNDFSVIAFCQYDNSRGSTDPNRGTIRLYAGNGPQPNTTIVPRTLDGSLVPWKARGIGDAFAVCAFEADPMHPKEIIQNGCLLRNVITPPTIVE